MLCFYTDIIYLKSNRSKIILRFSWWLRCMLLNMTSPALCRPSITPINDQDQTVDISDICLPCGYVLRRTTLALITVYVMLPVWLCEINLRILCWWEMNSGSSMSKRYCINATDIHSYSDGHLISKTRELFFNAVRLRLSKAIRRNIVTCATPVWQHDYGCT